MNMTIAALLLIVGTNILVGSIQLLIFFRTARALDTLYEITAEYIRQMTELIMKNFK